MRKNMSAFEALVGLAFIVVFLFLCYASAPDRDEAAAAVRSAGNKDVVIGTWRWFGCSKSDTLGWDFTATNALGVPVQGIVCCGNIKGCTVRY